MATDYDAAIDYDAVLDYDGIGGADTSTTTGSGDEQRRKYLTYKRLKKKKRKELVAAKLQPAELPAPNIVELPPLPLPEIHIPLLKLASEIEIARAMASLAPAPVYDLTFQIIIDEIAKIREEDDAEAWLIL